MKKSVRILLLSLLLSLALCGAAQAADDSGKLIPFPGDTWILTNNGSTEASISMKSMDFVVTDQDGTVRDRAVSWNKTISILPGGQAIAHCAFSPTTNAIILPEGVTAVKSAVPRLLHADLNYRETCEFRNVTDHDANVLVSGKNKNWAYFIYNSGGAVKEESFSPNATYTDSHYEQLLTVPSGGRAVIVATGVIGPSTEFTVSSCMARAENFTLT